MEVACCIASANIVADKLCFDTMRMYKRNMRGYDVKLDLVKSI